MTVFFRRPVFLRDYGDETVSDNDRFSKVQWAAFLRNLMIYDEALWINNPAATYRAEHKGIQLYMAANQGFKVPSTKITNDPRAGILGDGVDKVAVKGLDTVLSRHGMKERFGFTTIGSLRKIERDDWSSAPATVQGALTGKLDVRVTVVEDETFAASITADGNAIEGDWRVAKENARFERHTLPTEVAERCCRLVQNLGLSFAGIDLAIQGGEYYFLEANPTGEWSWLVDAAGLRIDEAIVNALVRVL